MGKTYIALLRGINVSGQKKIKMADLRDVLEQTDLKNVKTYIQSGNIVFDTDLDERNQIEEIITTAIQKQFGFEVPTLVIQGEDIERILKANPFSEEEENKLYYVLLKTSIKDELVKQFNQLQFEKEGFHITDSCVYLYCKNGYGNAKLNNNLIEKKLGTPATTRNQKTMLKLLEMVSD